MARASYCGGGETGTTPTGRPLSIYTADPGVANPKTVIAYGDQIGLGRWGTAGGEIASDGSWLATEHFRQHGLSLFGYVRDASGSGIAGAGPRRRALRLLRPAVGPGAPGLPLPQRRGGPAPRGPQPLAPHPLRLGSDVTLAADRFAIGPTRGETDSVEGATAFGHLQLRGPGGVAGDPVPGFLSTPAGSSTERDLLTAASYLVGTRLRIEGQLVERWPERSARTNRARSDASLALSRRTNAPRFSPRPRPRASATLTASVSTRRSGPIFPFSSRPETSSPTSRSPGSRTSNRNRLRIGLRHSWDLPTPSAGNGVEGFVASSGGLSPAGLGVELGPYRTVTDRDGHSRFQRPPRATTSSGLREQGLPADTTPGPAVRVRVKRERCWIPAFPSRPWVRPAAGSTSTETATTGATRTRGSAASWWDPGRQRDEHRRRRLVRVLQPSGPAPTSSISRPTAFPWASRPVLPTRMLLGLPAGSSIETLEFRLQDKHKPVVFQETRK